jgi:uncharacterized protein with HEPN domain
MSRENKHFLNDIVKCAGKIEKYIADIDFDNFISDDMRIDSVLRNLEIIGEAVKRLPDGIKLEMPEVEWKKISGLRDVLIHAYFNINLKIIWDIAKENIPSLKKSIENYLSSKNN